MAFFIILAIIIIILLIPVGLAVSYTEKLQLELKYLFFSINLTKEKPEKPPKKAKKKVEKKENPKKDKKPKKSIKDKIKDILKEKGPIGFLNIILTISKPIPKIIYNFIKCLYIKDLDIYYKVGGEDAAKIALDYGKACSYIYPCVNMFCNIAHIKLPRVSVEFDYNEKKSVALASCTVKIIPMQIIFVAVKSAVTLIKALIKVM